MPRKPMTEDEKKAFGEKMKAARLAKQGQNGTQPVGENGTTPVNPPAGTGNPPISALADDPEYKAKMAQLDEALRKTNELNAQIEEQEKIRSEAFAQFKPLSEAEKLSVIEAHKGKAQKMKESLQKQPKVRVFMPLEGKEKPGTQFPVTLNGYRVNVPKGVYVEIPQQVADVIMDSLNQTVEAEHNPFLIDPNSAKGDVLA
jgi:Fe-S cluster assembly scaffold protein SufB